MLRGHARDVAVAVALALLVVAAGCAMPAAPRDSATATAGTTTPAPPDNPWSASTVTVAVRADVQDRNYTALAAPALAYWNSHRERAAYADPPRLRFTDDPGAADVVLHYQPTIARCDGDTPSSEAGFRYCAPRVGANTSVQDRLDVAVTSRYTNQTTTALTVNALAGIYAANATPRTVTDPALRDPFPRTDTVVVGITYIADDRDLAPLVRATVDYWMATDDAHGDYTTDWVVRPNAPHPDVEILYVDTIVACGFGPRQDAYVGCAPLLSTDTAANTPVQVEIAAGYTNESTIQILKHEFGHLYGREHGEEPMPLMSATGDVEPRNATA